MDAKSLELMKLIYPDLRGRIFRVAQDVQERLKMAIRITQGWRSYKYQQELYAKGRELKDGHWMVVDNKKVVTNAPPGYSNHHFGLAFDICFRGDDPYLEKQPKDQAEATWEAYAKIVEANGLVSGKRFRTRPDAPHAELTYGLTLGEIRNLYEHGGLAGVWVMCDKIRGVSEMSEWKPEMLPPKEEVV